jgi:hypothetical protein
MAITKTIEIDVNTSSAEKDVNDLTKSIVKLENSIDDLGKSGKKSLDNIDKNVEETEKSTKSLSERFKTAGLALKAIGIGLVISLMSTLKEMFMSNQKVADSFSAILGTVANVFSQVTNVVVSVIEKIAGASNGFEGLKNVIGGLLKLGITPLKAAFYGIKLTIDEVRLAWEESIFGDGDPKTIKKLTERINETKTSLKEVATDAIAAGKQVGENIGKAINEVGAVVEGTIDGVSKISIAGAYEQAKANVQLQNTAQLAEAQQSRLVEQYDRQAEKLRQVRDNDLNSISDRIKANDELGKVLDNQEKAMLSQADLQIAAAKNTLALNNNIENRIALTNALANREGVLAQIEGFRSEQDSNKNALLKENIDLTKSKAEAENTLSLEQKKFNAELEKDELKKLDVQRQILEEEKRIESERLQFNIDSYAEGTQAKLDAQIEFDAKKQELDNALIENQRATAAEELAIEQAKAEQKRAIQQQGLDTALQGVGLIKGLFEKSKGVQKAAIIAESAIGIGKMIIANNLANVGALATPQAIASGGISAAATIAFNNISTGIGVAANLAATAKALQAVGGGGAAAGGGGASTGGGAPAAPAPQFNVVGNSGVNQIAQTLGSQQPIKTYVTASDVSTQQSLDRNIIQNASLG